MGWDRIGGRVCLRAIEGKGVLHRLTVFSSADGMTDLSVVAVRQLLL